MAEARRRHARWLIEQAADVAVDRSASTGVSDGLDDVQHGLLT